MTAADLIAFEREVADAFEAKKIHGPIHLAGSTNGEQEEALVEIFKEISPDEWVFGTWRSHYLALLHGVPRKMVMDEILAGRSMQLHFPAYHFFTSAIVGGILPIACGVAAAGARAWVFIGDMCASTGAFQDAKKYAEGHHLPIQFVIEDNGVSTNTPTHVPWGRYGYGLPKVRTYRYERIYPHTGSGVFVPF